MVSLLPTPGALRSFDSHSVAQRTDRKDVRIQPIGDDTSPKL